AGRLRSITAETPRPQVHGLPKKKRALSEPILPSWEIKLVYDEATVFDENDTNMFNTLEIDQASIQVLILLIFIYLQEAQQLSNSSKGSNPMQMLLEPPKRVLLGTQRRHLVVPQRYSVPVGDIEFDVFDDVRNNFNLPSSTELFSQVSTEIKDQSQQQILI